MDAEFTPPCPEHAHTLNLAEAAAQPLAHGQGAEGRRGRAEAGGSLKMDTHSHRMGSMDSAPKSVLHPQKPVTR